MAKVRRCYVRLDALQGRAFCGRQDYGAYTRDPLATTCARCRARLREALS